MPRKKSSPIFISYASVGRPDNAAFAELVKKAIGPDRTVSEFAEICGVSPSTMSRIVKNQFKTPSSDVVIKAIADNADPVGGVDADALLRASGRAPIQLEGPTHVFVTAPTEAGKSKLLAEVVTGRKGEPINNIIARETIQNALLSAGHGIKVSPGENIISIPGLRYKADFCIDLDLDEDLGFDKWAFDACLASVRPITHKLSWIFGAAYLDSTRDRRIKVSLVVSDLNDFDYTKKTFSNIKIHDLVSVVLIDPKAQIVIDEFQIPTVDGIKFKSLLTTKQPAKEVDEP